MLADILIVEADSFITLFRAVIFDKCFSSFHGVENMIVACSKDAIDYKIEKTSTILIGNVLSFIKFPPLNYSKRTSTSFWLLSGKLAGPRFQRSIVLSIEMRFSTTTS